MTYADWFSHRMPSGEITDDAIYTIPPHADADYCHNHPTDQAITQ
jgi:hypothetical protein